MNRLREYLDGAAQRFRGYKTHLLAFALFLVGILEAVDPWAVASILPGRSAALFPSGVAVAIFLLRRLTKSEDGVARTLRKRRERRATEGLTEGSTEG